MSIQAKNVSKTFGSPPVKAVTNVSLEIKEGEFVALTGKSGSGKSTLLYLLSSLDHVSEGNIEIEGQDLATMTKQEIFSFRNKYMGFVFQFHYLIAELTALENVLLPTMKLKTNKARAPFAKDLLDQFGLGDKQERLPSQLSGGEQQRIAIARALIMGPRYLFADEPTGSLDSANGNTVMALLKKANKERGTTIIMVTHDPEYAARADKIFELKDGELLG